MTSPLYLPKKPQEVKHSAKHTKGSAFSSKKKYSKRTKRNLIQTTAQKKESFSEMMRILPVTRVERTRTSSLVLRIIKLPWIKPKEIQASLWSLNEVLMQHFPIPAHPSSLLNGQGPGSFPSLNLCRDRF